MIITLITRHKLSERNTEKGVWSQADDADTM